MVMDEEPDIVDEPEEVAYPASQQSARDSPALNDDDPAGVAGPAHHQNPAVDGPTVVDGPVAHGTPAGNTPAAGQDSSTLSDVSSLLFPSLPRAINQTTLIDFMSMWTLMQRRMDPAMAVIYAQARPAAQSTVPTPRDDDTPPRRSNTPPRKPHRWPRMPVRRSRTPVRKTRGLDDTRESTRSHSPIRRSSSSDSPPRDASHVNFSVALASLLDLGDNEVIDWVSWLDQPSLKDTMASMARIAQGLKEDEEVEKTTLSETLNTSSSTFKHLTVKQIFPREPYRLKVHRDAQYVPKPPGDSDFSDSKSPSSYQMSHRMCLDTEELARRSAIYASLADSMVASVIEELSPKDERTKLLREKLAIIQEAQVSAVSAGFADASNLQLLRRDALLKNFGFQPQVLSTVRTAPFEGSHVLGPEPKVLQNRVRTIRQADRMAGLSVSFTQKHHESKSSTKATSRKTASWTSVFDHLGSPTATMTQRTVTQEPPFRSGAGRGARHRPYPDSRKKPGRSFAASSTRQCWRVPGGGLPGRLCPALAESAGQLPGHQHCRGRGGHCIPATTSAHPSVHQVLDQKQPAGPPASRRCLAAQGSHRAGHQRDIPRVLQPAVPGPKEDRIDLSTLNRHMVVPHFKMETQGSVCSAIRSGIRSGRYW